MSLFICSELLYCISLQHKIWVCQTTQSGPKVDWSAIATYCIILYVFSYLFPLYNIFYDFIIRRTYLTLSLFMWALNLSKISNRLLGLKSYYLRHTFKMVGREKPWKPVGLLVKCHVTKMVRSTEIAVSLDMFLVFKVRLHSPIICLLSDYLKVQIIEEII